MRRREEADMSARVARETRRQIEALNLKPETLNEDSFVIIFKRHND